MSDHPTPPRGIPVVQIEEPPITPDDTSPTKAVRRGISPVNVFLYSAAVVITAAAAVLYIQQGSRPPVQTTPAVTAPDKATSAPATATTIATVVPTTVPVAAMDSDLPPDVVAFLLSQPGDTLPPNDQIFRLETAYTVAPVRTRSHVEEYVIQPGDTLDRIAKKFGLSTDTLIWNNDDIYVNRLQPGDTLTILPENGIRYTTSKDETIQAIADTFKVSPYVIIDSEYNQLQNANPTTLLPPNYTVIVPGGTSTKKAVYWNPGTSYKPAPVASGAGGSGVSQNAQGLVEFGGGSGSCGFQPNGGGTGTFQHPVQRYVITRGFFPGHSGIDLAAPAGTPVFAADSGTIIFAGWSDWGYGNAIVIAHGSFMTLYGHLSRINVSCGQSVSQGGLIGAVGSTGNSTAPHLHFEIRPGGIPANPVNYMSF